MLGFLIAVASGYASAWTLDNTASSLAFATVKASDIGESHRFKSISGVVSSDGEVAIEIDLASVDTGIPIRDERMGEHLFQVIQFPTAQFNTSINLDDVGSIRLGGAKKLAVQGELIVGTSRLKLAFDVLVWRLADQSMVVSTVQPVIVNAASLNLVSGVEKLREIAGLPSISKAVPVTFSLTFRHDG
tara:strand:- start:2461 stop:3024 length:564 start_codon:yes stop_codon:yes gene_type:complete